MRLNRWFINNLRGQFKRAKPYPRPQSAGKSPANPWPLFVDHAFSSLQKLAGSIGILLQQKKARLRPVRANLPLSHQSLGYLFFRWLIGRGQAESLQICPIHLKRHMATGGHAGLAKPLPELHPRTGSIFIHSAHELGEYQIFRCYARRFFCQR